MTELSKAQLEHLWQTAEIERQRLQEQVERLMDERRKVVEACGQPLQELPLDADGMLLRAVKELRRQLEKEVERLKQTGETKMNTEPQPASREELEALITSLTCQLKEKQTEIEQLKGEVHNLRIDLSESQMDGEKAAYIAIRKHLLEAIEKASKP